MDLTIYDLVHNKGHAETLASVSCLQNIEIEKFLAKICSAC